MMARLSPPETQWNWTRCEDAGRSGLVTSAANSLRSKSDHHQQRTFSRSYGAILPSSFTRVVSSALVFSTWPPVSV